MGNRRPKVARTHFALLFILCYIIFLCPPLVASREGKNSPKPGREQFLAAIRLMQPAQPSGMVRARDAKSGRGAEELRQFNFDWEHFG